ncbi:hypothetical protein EST38_g11413 [Candolleomyces aberdarensis]|uniref:Uncharacterized protein n=1 Tax=Candolleomyces aberdarensis TaxID=2316362 RepID=A0A4Q2D4Z1_9AGAR|nr:hypothetical protein EST38_g11413 [Candolleomyces aberdarensis]
MRSTIVSAGLLALTLLTSQAALARPIAIEGNTEADLALRNSDIVADGLEVEARSIDELFDQLEARAKTRAKQRAANSGAKPRGGGQNRQRTQNRNSGPRNGGQNRQRNQNQNRNSGQRQRNGPSTLNRILRSPVTGNIATTLAGGVAQRIAGGGAPPEGVERREFEEYLEARTRTKSNQRQSPPRQNTQRTSSGVGRTLNRVLNSQTGQTVVSTLADGVAQRIANGSQS